MGFVSLVADLYYYSIAQKSNKKNKPEINKQNLELERAE